MPVALDHITERKLVLTKQLYQLAVNQSEAIQIITNRIFAVIGFDLTIETLLKAVVGGLDQSKLPSEQFNGLLDQCDSLLLKYDLPQLPYRGFVLHIHSIRNDAQHKGKYPNETDVSDCRTYTRDFCREVMDNVWDIAFDDLSQIELINDTLLKELLIVSLVEIEQKNYKKALTLTESAFFWASRTIREFLPPGASGIYDDEFRDSKDLIKRLNATMKNIGDTALFYSILLSSGVKLADYKLFRERTVVTHFISEMTRTDEGDLQKIRAQIHWGDKEPNEQESLWVHSFVVNSILHWQAQNLTPRVPEKWTEHARILLTWGNNVRIFDDAVSKHST